MNDILVIGLGVMGSNLALNIADHNFNVAVYNRTQELTKKFLNNNSHSNIHAYFSLKEAIQSLTKPRKVMVMVSAGEAVDWVIDQVVNYLNENDIVMDGGNSYYQDTIKRETYLKDKGIIYYGIGISGGAYGARHGASMMVGGDLANYPLIEPIINAIGALTRDGTRCAAYMGSDGAGHFVKMIHNGIEYGDMQLIVESYLLLRQGLMLDNASIAAIYKKWNNGELNSYLLKISERILIEKDPLTGSNLIDCILDVASQKGTGKWSSQVAFDLGCNASNIQAATNARIISNESYLRNAYKNNSYNHKAMEGEALSDFNEAIRKALYLARVVTYAQGFDIYRSASNAYNWHLPMHRIAQVFKAGCIIQSQLLYPIEKVYLNDPMLAHLLLADEFKSIVQDNKAALVNVINWANLANIPLPVFNATLIYLQQISADLLGANLIQAQRDYFGAHTFLRYDQKGAFHHEWNENTL